MHFIDTCLYCQDIIYNDYIIVKSKNDCNTLSSRLSSRKKYL